MISQRNQKLSLPITTKQQLPITERVAGGTGMGGDKGNYTNWLKPASLHVILKLNPSILQASGTDSWFLEWTGRLGPPSLGSHVTLLSKGSFLQR